MAGVAVILAVVGAYYYLRIIKLVYFDAPTSNMEIAPTVDSKVVLTVNVLAIVVILPWIGSLIALCNQVISKLAY